MARWYCNVGGQQYGPVTKEELGLWVAQGRVKGTDYVWEEGMANWVLAATVFTPVISPPPSAIASMVAVAPPGGTGGQTPNGQLNDQALELLRGRWGLAMGFCVLIWLIEMGISLVLGLIPLGSVAAVIVSAPFKLSMPIFFLTFVRRGSADMGMLFSGFNRFGAALGTILLISLFAGLLAFAAALPGLVIMLIGAVADSDHGNEGFILGGVLAYIPAIIVWVIVLLCYSQSFYLLADDRNLGPMAAMRASREMMRGFKGKLFGLGLRYFGWGLLCILTLGIGFLWLAPYAGAGYARFYDDLRRPTAITNPV